jgi:hypothetical protein
MSDPRDVCRGVPLVDDALLLELKQEVHDAQDLVDTRSRRRFFGRLLDRVTGRDRRFELATAETLAGVQRRTLDWVESLAAQRTMTDLALAEVYDGLIEATHRLDRVQQLGEWTASAVQQLAEVLGGVAGEMDARLAGHDLWLASLEGRLAMDDAVRRWRYPRPDPGLPWLVRAVLLAREVALGPAGEYVRRTQDPRIERRLMEVMLQDPPTPWYAGVRSVPRMLTEAWQELPTDDHRLMIAELLGHGSGGLEELAQGPLTASLATTMSLAAQAGIGDDPARTALIRHSGNGPGYLPSSLSVDELVRQIAQEQFKESDQRWARLGVKADDE